MSGHGDAATRTVRAAVDLAGPLTPVGDNALLRMLRTQTGDLHQALDTRLRAGGALPLTRAHYTAFLRATSAIVVPIEVPLAIRLGPLFVKERAGERRACLVHDLELLDASLAEPWPTLPAIESTADAFGAAYVLLGSHLGGEVIARAFVDDEPGAPRPTTYVQLYHGEVGAMWRRFMDALGSFSRGCNEPTRSHVAAVAVALFTAFDLALDREGVAR